MQTPELPTLTTLSAFKRALVPGAFLKSTHFRYSGPAPKLVASRSGSHLVVKTFNPQIVADNWVDSYLAFGPAKEWSFDGQVATFDKDGNLTITYQFIDRTTWEALVRSCYPEMAETLINTAIAELNLPEDN